MRAFLAVLLAVGAIAAIAGIGTAYAGGLDGSGKRAERERPSLVAIAIGALKEADGGHSIVDLRAALREGDARGNLRFYCPEMGYYNGGVRTLSVENGIIKATGAGPLHRPDGQRVPVHYEAEINQGTKHVTIRVQGREGVHYSMEGVLEPGFVKAGAPPAPATEKNKEKNKEERRPSRASGNAASKEAS